MSTSVALVLRSRRVIVDAGSSTPAPASIHISGGVISRVAGWADIPEGAEMSDAGDLVIMPGIVDSRGQLPGAATGQLLSRRPG